MRQLIAATILGGSLFTAGCASNRSVTLPAIGPDAAAAPAKELADPSAGTLVVYSDFIPVAKHRTPSDLAHSGYVVRKASGEVVAHVDNNVAEAADDPTHVRLPAGLYQIDARCAKLGMVVVPVLISPGQRTEVFLDESGMPTAQSAALADPVRLPDGRVVGARAVTPAHAVPSP